MTNPYTELAGEVLGDPKVLAELTDWFDSDKARSAFQFGIALGKVDEANTIAPFLRSWLEAGRCSGIVAGYLLGVAERTHGLASEWTLQLDEAAKLHPEYAATVTMQGDPSIQGFQRVFGLISNDRLPLKFLRGLGWGPWLDVLHLQDKEAILAILTSRCEREPAETVSIALGLLAHWSWKTHPNTELPAELIEPALAFLRVPLHKTMYVDHHSWNSVLEAVVKARPAETAELILDALTLAWPGRIDVLTEDLPHLVAYAAKEPHQTMEAVGRCLLDPKRRMWLTNIVKLPGLFEAIGLEAVKNWLDQHGLEHMKDIAPHLESPRLQDGKPFIPPVTKWMFTEFADDEMVLRAFCTGRHVMEFTWGNARDRRPELERTLEPFRNHELRGVRKWVEYELKWNNLEATMDEHSDERLART